MKVRSLYILLILLLLSCGQDGEDDPEIIPLQEQSIVGDWELTYPAEYIQDLFVPGVGIVPANSVDDCIVQHTFRSDATFTFEDQGLTVEGTYTFETKTSIGGRHHLVLTYLSENGTQGCAIGSNAVFNIVGSNEEFYYEFIDDNSAYLYPRETGTFDVGYDISPLITVRID